MGKVFGNKKVKSSYFMSVAQNSHLTNKPEANGGAHFTLPRPLSISALFYGYLKLRKKSKNGFVVTPETACKDS